MDTQRTTSSHMRPWMVFRNIGRKLNGIRDMFVLILRDMGYFDHFRDMGDTMLSKFWGYLPYLF